MKIFISTLSLLGLLLSGMLSNSYAEPDPTTLWSTPKPTINYNSLSFSQHQPLAFCSARLLRAALRQKHCLSIIESGLFSKDRENLSIAYHNLAMSYNYRHSSNRKQAKENLEQARKYLEKAIQISPKDSRFYHKLLAIYKKADGTDSSNFKVKFDQSPTVDLTENARKWESANPSRPQSFILFKYEAGIYDSSHIYKINNYRPGYVLFENSEFLLTTSHSNAMSCAIPGEDGSFNVLFNAKYNDKILDTKDKITSFLQHVGPIIEKRCESSWNRFSIYVNGFLIEPGSRRVSVETQNSDTSPPLVTRHHAPLLVLSSYRSKNGEVLELGARKAVYSIEELLTYNGTDISFLSASPEKKIAELNNVISLANAQTLKWLGVELFETNVEEFKIAKVLVGSPAFLAGLSVGDTHLKSIESFEHKRTCSNNANCILKLFRDFKVGEIRFVFKSHMENMRYGPIAGDDMFRVDLDWFNKSRSFGKRASQLPQTNIKNIWKRYLAFNAYGILLQENSNLVKFVAPYSPAYFAGIEVGFEIRQMDSTAINTVSNLADSVLAIMRNKPNNLHRVHLTHNGNEFFRDIFVASDLFPMKAGYFPQFDLKNKRYQKLVVQLKSHQEQRTASSQKNKALLNAIISLASGNGDFVSTTTTLTKLLDETKRADNAAFYARSRIYALEGNICEKREAVVFCSNSTETSTSYLGRGHFQTTTLVTSLCSAPCYGHSGFCDMTTGEKYFSAEQAERANCRRGTQEQLLPLLRITQ